MERTTTAVVAGFAALAIGGLVVALWPPPAPPPAPAVAPATPPPPPVAPPLMARVEAAPGACGLTLPPGAKLAALLVRPGDALAVGQVFARLGDGRDVRSPRAGKVTLLGMKVGEVAGGGPDAPGRPAVVIDPAASLSARVALPVDPAAPAVAVHVGDAIPLRPKSAAESGWAGVVVEVLARPGGVEIVLDLPSEATVAIGDALTPTLPEPSAPPSDADAVAPVFAGIVVAAPSLASRRLQPSLSATPKLQAPPKGGFRLDDGATSAPRLGAGPPGGAAPSGGFRLKPATSPAPRPLLPPPPRTEPP